MGTSFKTVLAEPLKSVVFGANLFAREPLIVEEDRQLTGAQQLPLLAIGTFHDLDFLPFTLDLEGNSLRGRALVSEGAFLIVSSNSDPAVSNPHANTGLTGPPCDIDPVLAIERERVA